MEKNTDHTLAGIDLFAKLTDEERSRFEKLCGWRTFQPDEQIIDRQDESFEVFFLIRGKVRIVNYSLSGREISFDDLEAGSFFGELAAIDGLPRSASVVSISESLVASMGREAFRSLILAHPECALILMNRLAHIVRTATDRIMDLSTLGANNRVQAELLRLARRSQREDGTAEIHPIPIHADIASRVSTTRETVARVISDLSRRGLVTRRGDALQVTDIACLEEMVEDFRSI